MNINVFNDCENEYLFVDSAYMYKTCFLDKSSNLLQTILNNYKTSERQIEVAWRLILEGKVPSDKVSLAYILILNDLILESFNYTTLQIKMARQRILRENVNATETDIAKEVTRIEDQYKQSLNFPKLNASQFRIYSLILKTYATVLRDKNQSFASTYKSVINPILRIVGSTSKLTYSPLMDCEANNFMSERFFSDAHTGRYRLNLMRNAKGQVLLGAIALIDGSTPPSAMSINTLVFPTTVAPIIAFNSPLGQPKAMVGLAQNLNQIEQVTEQLQKEHRVSPTGDITLEAKRELLQNAKSILDEAQANGETSALMSTVSARLRADVDAMSKDPSSPYFGMAPKDIKAGFLSTFLGGSSGYNELAMKIDHALTKGIKCIQTEVSLARFAIAEYQIHNFTQAVRDDVVTSANANIEETTERINNLLSVGSPFFEIDEAALRKRGFNPTFEPIPRANEGVSLVTIGAALGLTALVTVFILGVMKYLSVLEEEEAKKQLILLKHKVKSMRAFLQEVLRVADSDFETAKSNFLVFASNLQEDNLDLIDGKDPANDLVETEISNIKFLYKKIKQVSTDTALTQASLKDQLTKILNNVDITERSIVKAIQTEDKIIEEAKKKDPIGALLRGTKDGIDKLGDLLRYAGYISLGLFSIWGGVKLYRSLNSEED